MIDNKKDGIILDRKASILGAIIGDIVGSRFEWNNHKNKQFEMFTDECFFTDDSVMTIAVAKALMTCKYNYSNLAEKAISCMQALGRKYPHDLGGNFYWWIFEDNPKPYHSWGNGAAMRVSACSLVAKSIEDVKLLSRQVTEVSHNHTEGLKGAEATAIAIYLARIGYNKDQIRKYINNNYYSINFTLDEIRSTYQYDESCQGSVPYALQSFFESTGFEDAIRNAISIGGDSDTIAAITGGIAAAYYGIPTNIRQTGLKYLTVDLKKIVMAFEEFIAKTT